MRHILYCIIFLFFLGCSPEQRFDKLESQLYVRSLIFQVDEVEIKIPAKRIYDSLTENILEPIDSLYFNQSKIEELSNYEQQIISESINFDRIKKNEIRNSQPFDPKILAEHLSGILIGDNTVWLDIYLDSLSKIRLLTISDKSNNHRIYQNFIYKNDKIVFIKKVFIESKRIGWEHVSNNVFESEFYFSENGLMRHKLKDYKEFPKQNYNEENYNADLKEKTNDEYFNATYLFCLANYLKKQDKLECIDKELKVEQTKSEIEKIFNDSIKMDITNFGRLRPNFTAILKVNENGKILHCKIQNMYMDIITKDNKDILLQMKTAFQKLKWKPAQSNCKNIKSEIRIQYRHDGFKFHF